MTTMNIWWAINDKKSKKCLDCQDEIFRCGMFMKVMKMTFLFNFVEDAITKSPLLYVWYNVNEPMVKYKVPFSHVGRIDELNWHFYCFYVPKRKAKHSILNTIDKLINNLNINKPVTVFRLKETEISEFLIYISKFSTPTFFELYYNIKISKQIVCQCDYHTHILLLVFVVDEAERIGIHISRFSTGSAWAKYSIISSLWANIWGKNVSFPNKID